MLLLILCLIALIAALLNLKQSLVAIDQTLNAVFLGGWADESVSARAWRSRDKPKWARAVKLIDRLFFWQEAHCKTAFERETERMQLPPEYRNLERKETT